VRLLGVFLSTAPSGPALRRRNANSRRSRFFRPIPKGPAGACLVREPGSASQDRRPARREVPPYFYGPGRGVYVPIVGGHHKMQGNSLRDTTICGIRLHGFGSVVDSRLLRRSASATRSGTLSPLVQATQPTPRRSLEASSARTAAARGDAGRPPLAHAGTSGQTRAFLMRTPSARVDCV